MATDYARLIDERVDCLKLTLLAYHNLTLPDTMSAKTTSRLQSALEHIEEFLSFREEITNLVDDATRDATVARIYEDWTSSIYIIIIGVITYLTDSNLFTNQLPSDVRKLLEEVLRHATVIYHLLDHWYKENHQISLV